MNILTATKASKDRIVWKSLIHEFMISPLLQLLKERGGDDDGSGDDDDDGR